MHFRFSLLRNSMLTAALCSVLTSPVLASPILASPALASAETPAPLPDIPSLMREVQAHQRELTKIRENYTYKELQFTEQIDKRGQVSKTESEEDEIFFVNGHEIHRKVRKDGKPLSGGDERKEQERVTKQIEKAEHTPPDRSLDGHQLSISRLLEIMKVSNPRRITLNGRSTIAFDFTGDPHAKTHGMEEDMSKKIEGSLWVDERDRQVTRMEARFNDNFRMAAGLLATIQKGSSVIFEQGLVNNELWLPTGGTVDVGARVLLVKGYHIRIRLKNSDYQRFHAEAIEQPGQKQPR